MLTFPPSSIVDFCAPTTGLSGHAQLATRLKDGSCTDADENKINSLLINLDSEESKRFFNNSTVQRRLLKGFLDGKITDGRITDGRIKSALEQCTPSLKPADQINIIQSRAEKISTLSPAQTKK